MRWFGNFLYALYPFVASYLECCDAVTRSCSVHMLKITHVLWYSVIQLLDLMAHFFLGRGGEQLFGQCGHSVGTLLVNHLYQPRARI